MSDLRTVRRRARPSSDLGVGSSGDPGSPARKPTSSAKLDSGFTLVAVLFLALLGSVLVSFFVFPSVFPEAALQKALTSLGLQQVSEL